MLRFAGFLLAAVSVGATAQAPRSFHTIDEVPAPASSPWALPLAGGAIKAVAIVPYSAMGDLAMLQAHLSLELETVATWDAQHLGYDPLFPEPQFPDAAREAVEQRITAQLDRKKIALIIIGGCDPAILPESAQRRIIEHVESGAGLILAGTESPREGALATWLASLALEPAPEAIMRGVGTVGIPEADQAQLVTAGTAGSGRVALFAFQHAPTPNHALIPVPSNPYALLPEHETNALSLLCKAAVWATGREGGDSIHQLIDLAPKGPQDEDIPPGFPREFIEAVRKNALNQPVRPYALQLNAPSGATYDVVYQVRVPGASLPALRVDAGTELRKGADGCALDIMTAPGIYFVDIWLLNRKGVVYWHTEALEVPGWPRLRSIDITQDGKDAVWLHPNDHLDIAVEVEPGGFLTAGGEASVRARAVDSFGREVAHALSPITPEGGAVSLRLELADLLAPLIRVEIIASEDSLANQAARSTYYFPVRLPDPPLAPTVALVSPGPFDYATGRQLARLRTDLGATALHAPSSVESLLAASMSGLNRIAQVGSLDMGHVSDGTVRSPCLSSETFWERESEQIKSGVLASWAGGPPAHSLGAEAALTGTDANVCQSPDCLAHFRTALRESYGDIGRLNQAWGSTFSTWTEVTPVALDQCQQTGNWAPWLDFRLAMNDVLARALDRGRAIVQEVPGAGRCGFISPAGNITPLMGYDWWKLAQASDFMTVPSDRYALRRLQSYQREQPYSGMLLAYAQLNQDPEGAAWLAWDAILRQIPAVWVDRPINMGPHNLVAPSGRLGDGLAALARALDQIHGGPGQVLLNAIPHHTGIALADSTASRYLDYGDPEPGRTAAEAEDWVEQILNQLGFNPVVRPLTASLDGFNTVVLSRARVLSEEELTILGAFHDQGGLIVADGRAGQFDIHGVERQRAPMPYLHPLQPDTESDDFSLWTNRPVWVNQAGDASSPTTLLAQLLTRAGNAPNLAIQLPEKLAGAAARYQYQFGAATLVACLPDRKIDASLRRASFEIPEGLTAYDMLSVQESEPRRRVQWALSPGTPSLYALLPYRVEGLLLEVPEFAIAGERLPIELALDTGDTLPGVHCIQIQVDSPARQELRHYRQTLMTVDGRVRTYIPLAQNEAPGLYTLRARDALTLASSSVFVEIQ